MVESQGAAESASTPKSGCAMPSHTAILTSIGLLLGAIWEMSVYHQLTYFPTSATMEVGLTSIGLLLGAIWEMSVKLTRRVQFKDCNGLRVP
jgi:hypothetical protein